MNSLRLTSYAGGDNTSFLGFSQGNTFDAPGGVNDPESYTGYTHFGPGSLNMDLLPAMAGASGAAGFEPPLEAGDYVFRIQQQGGATSYQFSFEITPVPELRSQLAFAFLCAGYFLYRRRRSPGATSIEH